MLEPYTLNLKILNYDLVSWHCYVRRLDIDDGRYVPL